MGSSPKREQSLKMELKTIKTFDDSVEAHLMQSRLENEGIQSFVFDDNIIGVNPLFNITVGGIKLKVDETDVDQANSIIGTYLDSRVKNEQGEIVTCPKCSSESIYSGFKSMKDLKGVLSAILAMLLFVFPVYYKTLYKCKSCGNEFTSEA